jgi:hypothetical protein
MLVENTPVELRLVDGVTDRMNAIELVADVDTARPQQNRLRIKVALAEGETVSLREARQRMRQISPEAIERFRPGTSAGPNTSIAADSSLLGFPVKLEADVESLPAIQLEKHQVILFWPESSLPMAVSESLLNSAEGAALVDIAVAHPTRRFIATSPYRAQCRLIAEKGSLQNLTNLRVVFGERLGHRSVERGTELLISLVASNRQTTSGWPLNELGHVLPLFLGAWSKIIVVCSPYLAAHHPLIRQLAHANES